jgi:hypothetical protein
MSMSRSDASSKAVEEMVSGLKRRSVDNAFWLARLISK